MSLDQVVTELNQTLGQDRNLTIELLKWETHTSPCMGRTQGIVNAQIGQFDILVGIMWKRFGTPTGVAESGTEEEFRKAYDLWSNSGKPEIMFYFCQKEFMPGSLDEIDQFRKVFEFKELVSQKGLVLEYDDPIKFPNLVRPQLYRTICNILAAESPGTTHGPRGNIVI